MIDKCYINNSQEESIFACHLIEILVEIWKDDPELAKYPFPLHHNDVTAIISEKDYTGKYANMLKVCISRLDARHGINLKEMLNG
jgi:hypothetical protein